MTNTPTTPDPIVAQYQSNGHQATALESRAASQLQKKKGWTGFAEKTLWDWLNLLGVLLVPLMIGVGTILITVQQSAISQSQHDSDQRIADNQFQESLLKTFRDDINRLVLDKHLLTAKYNDPVQIMAYSYTNDALRKLDLSRRVLLVRFLSDLHLIVSTTNDSALVSLSGIKLGRHDLTEFNHCQTGQREFNLRGNHLCVADLREVYLSGADLSRADLLRADLSGADLSGADLSGAALSDADLVLVNLRGARVTPQQLAQAYSLKDVTLPDGSHYPSSSYPVPNHQEPTK